PRGGVDRGHARGARAPTGPGASGRECAMSTAPASVGTELNRWKWRSLGVGLVALLVCFLAAPFTPDPFFRAYLAAYLFWLGIPLGCFAILMIYHLTGGAWGFLIRRVLEAGM